MSIENLFQTATRSKFRFPSPRGDLNVEMLWDLPLQHKSGCDLDQVARAVNTQLKALTEESFVSTTSSPAKKEQETKLEIVKHIISVKQAEAQKAQQAAARREEKTRLLEILHSKKNQELEGLDVSELQRRIDALSAE